MPTLRFLVPCLIGLALTGPAAAAADAPKAPAGKPKDFINITVYDFHGGEGVDESIPKALGARLRQKLLELPRYRIIDVSNMGVTEVQQIVSGRISKTEEDYTVIIEVLNPLNTTVISSYVQVCPKCSVEDLLALTDAASDVLFRGKPKSGTQAAEGPKSLRAPEVPPLTGRLTLLLPDADADVLVARDEALRVDKDGVVAPDLAASAWGKLAAVPGANPYQAEAAKRQRDWEQYIVQSQAFEKQRAADADRLQRALGLATTSLDEKRAAVARYSKTYGGYAAIELLEGMNLDADLITELQSSPLTITSQPAEADVLIDGAPRGRTPWQGSVLSGKRRVELRHDGFQAIDTQLVVLPDLENQHVFTLTPRRDRVRFALLSFAYAPLSANPNHRELAASGAAAPLPDSLELASRSGGLSPMGLPVGLVVEGGYDHLSLGYGYARSWFRSPDIKSLVTPTAVIRVQQAVVQEHLLRAGYNWYRKLAVDLRMYGLVEAGAQQVEAAVASDRASAVYSDTALLIGGLAGVQAAYHYGALGVEAGARAAGGEVRPEIRILVSAGSFSYEFE